MKLGVGHKLFFAMLTAAGLAVISSLAIMHWSLNRGFHRYVATMEKTALSRLAVRLEEEYRREGSWDSLRRDPRRWRHLVVTALPLEEPPPRDGAPPGEPPPAGLHPGLPRGAKPPPDLLPPHLARQFDERLYLLDAGKRVVVSRFQLPPGCELTPLRQGGAVVGYLGILPRPRFSDSPQNRFLKEQQLAFALTAGVVVLLAAGLSLASATRLVRPVRELARATHQLAAGTYSVRVPMSSRDELGQLAGDFNSLARILEANEQARRQWVADISHELRTPLAILRGEIEALLDGIRQPSPQTIQSLHGEILRLGRLVDDLYQLSLHDLGALSYRKVRLDLAEVLDEAAALFRPEFGVRGISLVEEIGAEEGAILPGDPERLRQLFSNLLDNALKYTDPGGTLLLRLERRPDALVVDFQDSAPGVPDAALEKLFDRLYRVDGSRSRSSGGAGLGLAICRTIVEAHGGSIAARHSPRGGLWVRIEFPRKGSMS